MHEKRISCVFKIVIAGKKQFHIHQLTERILKSESN